MSVMEIGNRRSKTATAGTAGPHSAAAHFKESILLKESIPLKESILLKESIPVPPIPSTKAKRNWDSQFLFLRNRLSTRLGGNQKLFLRG